MDGSIYVQWDIQSLSEVDRDTLLPVLIVSGTPIGQAGRGGRGGGGQRGGQLDMSIGHWTNGQMDMSNHSPTSLLTSLFDPVTPYMGIIFEYIYV